MAHPMRSLLQQLKMLWAWIQMSGSVGVYTFIRITHVVRSEAKSPVTSISLSVCGSSPGVGIGGAGMWELKPPAKSMVLGYICGSNAIKISQSIYRLNHFPYLVSGRYLL